MAAAATEGSLPPDENRGPEILAVCGSLVGLSLAVVLLRVWVRTRMVGRIGADDWTIIAAMTVMFVELMVIIPQVRLGAGRHVQYITPPENVTKGLHLNFVTQPLCLIALCLTKVSVGLFLLRLTPSRRFRYFVLGTVVFTVLSAAGNFLTVMLQCRPLALTWDQSVQGTCIPPSNLKLAAFFNSSVAALTDIIFALLPIPMLWKVQMNWKVKSAVAGILSLGLFAAIAAVVKITFLGSYGKHGDFLWDSADITIWTTVEINVAIIAASFPCLKPLFKTILEGSSAALARYGSSRYYHHQKAYYLRSGGAEDDHDSNNNYNKSRRRSAAPSAATKSSSRASRTVRARSITASGAQFEFVYAGGAFGPTTTTTTTTTGFTVDVKSEGPAPPSAEKDGKFDLEHDDHYLDHKNSKNGDEQARDGEGQGQPQKKGKQTKKTRTALTAAVTAATAMAAAATAAQTGSLANVPWAKDSQETILPLPDDQHHQHRQHHHHFHHSRRNSTRAAPGSRAGSRAGITKTSTVEVSYD